MDKYLKGQLHLRIFATVLWVVALCATISEFRYHLSGKPSCFEACIPPIAIGTCAIIYFWWVWVVDYKKSKNKE